MNSMEKTKVLRCMFSKGMDVWFSSEKQKQKQRCLTEVSVPRSLTLIKSDGKCCEELMCELSPRLISSKTLPSSSFVNKRCGEIAHLHLAS